MNKPAALTLSLILLAVACSGSGYEIFYGHSRQIKAIHADEWFKGE